MDDMIIYVNNFSKVFNTFKAGIFIEIFVSIVIGYILFKVIEIADNKFRDKILESKRISPLTRFVPILSRVFKGIVVFFLLASFLQSHGYSMSSLIAGFGITGLAVGFAAKETIANVFGTFAVLSDHSYEIGDYICVNDMEGVVEDINMRSTKIRNLDNSLVILPNNMVSQAIIKNVTAAHKRRIYEIISVTYDTSDEKLKRAVEIVEEVLNSHGDIYSDFYVFLDTLADSSINIKLNAYVKTNNYVKFVKIREQILLEIIKRYRAEGIDFAFPSRTLYMAK